MSLSFTCPHCSTGFPVAEEDRGFSVYCDSCGRECSVPEDLGASKPAVAERPAWTVGTMADSAPAEPVRNPQTEIRNRRASVFTAEGANRVLEKPAGEVECFRCNTRIPYTIEQQGTTVYCPSCGDGVPVGEQLQKIAVARAATLRDEQESVHVPVAKPRFYWFRSRAGLATLAAAVVVLAGGVYATWRDPSLLPEGIRTVLPTGEASVPKRRPKPDDKKQADDELPAEKITLDAIRKLLDRKDTRMALIQAQYWEQDLKRQKLPPTEPRRQELAKVIATLFERLTPGPKNTPKYVLRFRKLIDDLGKALADTKVSDARKLYDEAKGIFDKHSKELAGESSWLVTYDAWLKRLELKANGVRQVRTALNRAADLAREGRPTQALEQQARARWQARFLDRRSVPESQFALLEKLNSGTVKPLIRWARGKRAVFDAEDCQKNRDKAARDQQLEIATGNLPEIPQSLPGVPDTAATKLNVDARKLAARSIFSPVSTVLGKELDVRYRYEQALPLLAAGKTAEFAAAAADVKRRFDAINGRDRLHDPLTKILARLPDLAFEMLTQNAAALEDLPEDERPPKIVPLRSALTHLSVWNDRPQWKSLDASLRKLAKDLIATRLTDARAAAKAGNLERAVQLARDAEGMADGETAKTAHALRTQWEQDLKAQKSAAARAAHLKRIGILVDADKPLDAAREIAAFERLYGNAAAPLELAGYRTRIEKALQAAVDGLLVKSDGLQKQSQWGDLRSALAELDGVPLSASQQSRYDELQKALKSLKSRADALMIQLRRLRRLATPDEILRAMTLSRQVLDLDPANDEVKQLYTRAKSVAKTTAASMLRRGETSRNSRSSYLRGQSQRWLRDAIKLDPDGPHGKRAKELLKRR